ncbi:MAG TPA: PfkB family carbohydrate kinase [archaeon]|nr:PfkB family carbohydrate kinase [archaeon]
MGRVFAIGDINIDFFSHLTLPINFGEEHKTDFYYTLGGNAANFSVGICRLGVEGAIVANIGSDIFTSFLQNEISREGVKNLLMKSSGGNGISNILVQKLGERAILSQKGAVAQLDCKKVARTILPKIRSGDIVYFGAFFHLPKLRKGFANLLRSIKRRKAKVFFDACFDTYGNWGVKSFLPLIDVFFANEIELQHISGKKPETKGINWLFSKGATEVVLKKGKKGASYFSKNISCHMPALDVTAFNSTGAGDFFDAGFTYGYLNNFSPKNCLLAGSFVASKKISSKNYFSPNESSLKKFLGQRNLEEIVEVKNYNALSKKAAKIIAAQLQKNPSSTLCLAAGKTPIGVYKNLVQIYRRGEVDFSGAKFLELDEYIGVLANESFGDFLKKSFIEKVNFKPENVFLFNQVKNPQKESSRLARVARRGIDLLLLGIGENGHIAFNEPGSSFFSKTRIVKIPKGVLKRRGVRLSKNPSHAFTIGMDQISRSKKVILIASTKKKSSALYGAVCKKPYTKVPASILQRHPNSIILGDRAALFRAMKNLKG